ncbi:hypothetical protein PIB30_024286 [Stylosanthes scabra]|uniref:Uncharacterized protein n=1 Tax=Stylosanthes scabra TaxID=79078 RepID=A0ABU6W7W9_9FABA|nr:hypothetical protein [Stylosanthes scabra]
MSPNNVGKSIQKEGDVSHKRSTRVEFSMSNGAASQITTKTSKKSAKAIPKNSSTISIIGMGKEGAINIQFCKMLSQRLPSYQALLRTMINGIERGIVENFNSFNNSSLNLLYSRGHR